MAGQSRPRVLHLERIGDVFLNRLAALTARDLHDVLGYLTNLRGLDQLPGIGVRGVVVDGLNVVAQAVPDMTVQVGVGAALIPAPGTSGVVPTPQTSPDSNVVAVNKRLLTVSLGVDPPPPGSFRWDLIEVGIDATEYVDDSQVVDLYDVPGKKFIPTATPQPVMTHGEGKVFYTAGAPGGTLPPPTPGRVPIAAVLVIAGMTAITQDRIFDLRHLLSELASRSRADAPSEIDVAELAVDVPVGGTPVGAQSFSCHARGVVRGVACGFTTTGAPLDMAIPRDFLDFCDRNTRTKIITGSGPDWMYCYLVAADDQGYRLSRSNVPAIGGTPSGNRFSHAGVLVWSHVPPSLADGGSLAPSAALALSEAFGNAMVTPGVGRAVCIGCAYYGGATGLAFRGGLKSFRGEASFVAPAGVAITGLALTPTAEVMTGTIGRSAVRALWPASTPIGPLSYDVRMSLMVHNPVGAGAQRTFSVYEYQVGTAAADALCAVVETTITSKISGSRLDLVVRGMSVGRIPSTRATKTGFIVMCQVAYGSAPGGSGLSTSPADHAFALLGYRWPNGPVLA